LAQLALNLTCITLAGVATLTFQRWEFLRRLRRAAG
jgi:hypothetical protein